MKPQILNETTNFYKLYRYICGKSEIPEIYNFWSCVSIISAAMEDRFVCELYKGIPLKPNMYIGLIGPGSCGKGLAISQALQLLESAIDLTVYRGKVTFAHLIDRMGTSDRGQLGNSFIANPRLYLIMDELKNGVGSNRSLVDEFIGFMTEAYTASNYLLRTGNRSTGEVTLENPCLNWLFGSTPVWLRKVLTRDIYESGFVARTCFILAEDDLDKRIPRIQYPKDRDFVYEFLQKMLWIINQTSGELKLSPEAESYFDNWYYNRKVPTDKTMNTIWKRQKEMVIRLGMINCIADYKSYVIEPKHLSRACYMANQLMYFAETILEAANENWDTRPIADVEFKLKQEGKMKHFELLRYMRSKKGFDGARLKKVINTLRDERKIRLLTSKTGGIVYEWVK